MADIAHVLNPLLRGWISYYGRYTPSAMRRLFQHVNQTLLGWLRRKYKRFKQHKTQAGRFLEKLARDSANLFVHWRFGATSGFI